MSEGAGHLVVVLSLIHIWEVLGLPSRNLDLFFSGEDQARALLSSAGRGRGVAVLEGVMGCYDGVGGTEPVSSTHLEVCCREDRLAETLAAARAAHPYEEPVINVIPLAATGLEEKKQGWTPAVSRTRSKIARCV